MGNDGSLLYICSGILKGITVQLHMQRLYLHAVSCSKVSVHNVLTAEILHSLSNLKAHVGHTFTSDVSL